jgi:hypothetical protein
LPSHRLWTRPSACQPCEGPGYEGTGWQGDPIEGYVRGETLMPILGVQILPITDMPTRRVLALLTEDGSLAFGATAESAQEIARLLEKAASEMRLAS